MRELAVDTVSYVGLYERWERSQWQATQIDFRADRLDWDKLSDLQRRSMRWQFAMFFFAEDAVADNLSPYIDAAPKEEQKYFLATQQVDEARHAVFFSRFFREVLGSGASVAEGLSECTPHLNWAFRRTFERLDRLTDELRHDKSPPKFAQAIAMYHIIVEGTLGQPGQHFIDEYTTRLDILPGFRSGIVNVARDEQRHISFGVKTLSELFSQSEECKAAVIELLREVLPFTAGIFIPPGKDRRYAEELGFALEDIYTFSFNSLQAKLRATGLSMEEFAPKAAPVNPRPPVVDMPELEPVPLG